MRDWSSNPPPATNFPCGNPSLFRTYSLSNNPKISNIGENSRFPHKLPHKTFHGKRSAVSAMLLKSVLSGFPCFRPSRFHRQRDASFPRCTHRAPFVGCSGRNDPLCVVGPGQGLNCSDYAISLLCQFFNDGVGIHRLGIIIQKTCHGTGGNPA